MSEWTPEDAARLRQYAERSTKIDSVAVRRRLVLRVLEHIEKLEAEARTPRACLLTRREAEAFCDLRDLFADEENGIPIICEEDQAIVEIGGKVYPLDPPSPDPRIERTAEWLYLSSVDPMPGSPPPWSECPPSHQKTMRIRARDLLAAIDGEADDE